MKGVECYTFFHAKEVRPNPAIVTYLRAYRVKYKKELFDIVYFCRMGMKI